MDEKEYRYGNASCQRCMCMYVAYGIQSGKGLAQDLVSG